MRWAVLLVCLVPTLAAAAPRQGVPEDPREHREQVMQDPMFHHWQRRQARGEDLVSPGVIESLRDAIDGAFGSLEDFLDSLWSRNRPSGSGGLGGFDLSGMLEIAGWTALGVLLLILAVIAFRLIREHAKAATPARLTREQIRQALDQGQALAADAGQWLGEAERLADDADLRRAYRAMYLALLSGLHERRKIDFRRSRTNWIYVRGYRGDEARRGVFAGLTRHFDDVWYGLRQPERGSFDAVRSEVDHLLREEASGA